MKKLKLFLLILPVLMFVFLFKTATVAYAACSVTLSSSCGSTNCNGNTLMANWNIDPPTNPDPNAKCHIRVWGGESGKPGYIDKDLSVSCGNGGTSITGALTCFTDNGTYSAQASNDSPGCNPGTSVDTKTFSCQRVTACTLASWSLSTNNPSANTDFTATVTGKSDPYWDNVKWRVDSGAWSGTFTSVTPGTQPVFVFKPNSGAAGMHTLQFSSGNGARLCTPTQTFTTGAGGGTPPSGNCPADSNLTVSPSNANIGDTMTFQYKAGEDVYIGGDTWSGGVNPNPCTQDSNLANRKYTCTAQSAVAGATWKHYWNNGANCGSATYTIGGSTTPTSTPGPTGRTAFYRIAETPEGLNTAPDVPYTTEPISLTHTFTNETPGDKWIYVRFKGTKGEVVDVSKKIKLIGPDPVISNISCGYSPTGVGTQVTINGSNFGDRGNSKVVVGGKNAEITFWAIAASDTPTSVPSATLIPTLTPTNTPVPTATLTPTQTPIPTSTPTTSPTDTVSPTPSPTPVSNLLGVSTVFYKVMAKINERFPENLSVPVQLTTADGRSVSGSCSVNTTSLDFSTITPCRPADSFTTSDVRVQIYENTQGAKPVFNGKITLGEDGKPSWTAPRLEVGKSYIMIIKAPKTLALKKEFIALEGTTVLDDVTFPVGDIAPLTAPDEVINSVDKGELVREWTTTQDVTRPADFNMDSRVNSIDYSCMLTSFNKSGAKFLKGQ